MAKKKHGYEEDVKRLEEIADKIERGEMGLEQTIELFEEGIKLVKECQKFLNQTELKVNKLLENGESVEKFAPES